MGNQVAHPSHYNTGKIEVIEFIEDKKLNFHLGNAVKYISRAGKKDPNKHIEDLEKAVWYIEREISLLKGENIRPNDMRPRQKSIESFKERSKQAEANKVNQLEMELESWRYEDTLNKHFYRDINNGK